MQLVDIRTEVLARGFDATQFSNTRLNLFINQGYKLIVRRVDYYIDEASQTIATTVGQTDLTLPANWARIRSLLDTDLERELVEVGLRDIDRAAVASAAPMFYAMDGPSLRIYPTADGVHNLRLRYWLMPADLVLDADTPTLPTDWHHLLVRYATAECYKCEDDLSTGKGWEADFEHQLAMFEADQRFPSSDAPTQVRSMWGDESLGPDGWRRWPIDP